VFAAALFFLWPVRGDDCLNLIFSDLCKEYNGKNVFENISGEINGIERIGLVGANGVGKTTLARILAGLETVYEGKVECWPNNAKIMYIEQNPVYHKNITVYQFVFEAASLNYDGDADIDIVVKKALNDADLGAETWEQRASSLSGGEKTRLLLCRAVVGHYDLLILDEPTNHLDMTGCEWLEDLVRRIDKPMLVISHDRAFLDSVADKIWELTPGGLKAYKGNYSAYKAQKEADERSAAREYHKHQAKIAHLKSVIAERRGWYNNAHKSAGQNDFYRSKAKKHAKVIKAKEKELIRVEAEGVERPQNMPTPAFEVINKNIAGIRFPPVLIRGKDLHKAYGSRTVFSGASFTIKRRDRIAVIGQNGAGKTTLLKVMTGIDTDYRGTVSISPAVRVGYFAQELDNLKNDATILDEALTEGATVADARLLLACLLFRGDDVYKRIANLSMGEKGRVAFAKLILSGANLLVLDEPTNYMDIESREKIEDVLEDFDGCIVIVSHDRYLVQRLADRIFLIEDQRLHCYEGDYNYFVKKRTEQRAEKEIGAEYRRLTDDISRLECELAFLGGQLNIVADDQEKEILNRRFIETARELNRNKERLINLKATIGVND
jgi:ATP-binding cassette subfamily F protein 3